MSLKPSLPIELLDQIFYFLRDDPPALRASADVNQSFADIVEKHMYHHVTLGRPEMTAAQLSKILVNSPHIITYIKSLRISLSRTRFYSFLLGPPPQGGEFPPILPQLLHLTALSLYVDKKIGFPWSHIHSDFQSSFLTCIRSPTLVDVSIKWVTAFPLSLLEESPQLKSLSLIGPFSSSGLSVKQSVVTFPNLQSLTIETSPELVEWLDRTNITQLRSLVIWMCPGASADSIAGILSNSKYLTYLELHSSYRAKGTHCLIPIFFRYYLTGRFVNLDQVSPSESPLDLSVIPHLQHLYFGVEFFSLDDFGISSDGEEVFYNHILSTPNPWISRSLQTLFKLPTILLQSIIIDINLCVPKIHFHEIPWEPLVDTLQKIDSLKRVELQLKLDGSKALDYGSWAVETLKSEIHLARLIDTGLLSITMSSS